MPEGNSIKVTAEEGQQHHDGGQGGTPTTTTAKIRALTRHIGMRPSSQEVVDRLVKLTSEKRQMNQKEMEIIGKLTFGNIKAKRQVAATRVLIPRMIESYVQSGTITGGDGGQAKSTGGKMRSLFFLKRKNPDEDLSRRRTVSPGPFLVFAKALQACVVSNNVARTQCRDPRLYPILLCDLQTVATQVGSVSTRFKVLEATLDLLCVLCMNDQPNSKHLKRALDRHHGASLRDYAAGDRELGQRVVFLEAIAK